MKQKLAKLICRYGARLCAVALAVAPLASEGCRYKYYQPEEPEGLAAFAKKQK